MKESDVVLCHGPAGCGKTHLACGLASQYLRDNQVEKIILSRPAVDSGASIGYLPGTYLDKLGPYLVPLYDELSHFIESKMLKAWIVEHDRIEIVPLSMMRGRTFNNAFVILDEAQNATLGELKMCLTRLGQNSKMVITGDLRQSDLPYQVVGGFQRCVDALRGLEGVGICSLNRDDIVRHRLIAQIEERLSA
jgi:phosphate starvation-inducible PhoH-like protein